MVLYCYRGFHVETSRGYPVDTGAPLVVQKPLGDLFQVTKRGSVPIWRSVITECYWQFVLPASLRKTCVGGLDRSEQSNLKQPIYTGHFLNRLARLDRVVLGKRRPLIIYDPLRSERLDGRRHLGPETVEYDCYKCH